MKPQLRSTLAATAGLILALGQALPARPFEAEGHFDRTLKVTGPVELDVGTGSGSIDVRPGDASTVQIHGTIRASRGFFSDDAERRVRYLESNPPIEQHGNVIKIGRIEDRDVQRNMSISYEIVAPVETRVHSSSGSGRQTFEGIAGPLEATTGSGPIKALDIGSEVNASTGSGTIELRSVKGSVRASTGSGPIRAIGVAGGLRASTGSGTISLEQTAPGDVEVSTGSGHVELKNVRGAVRAQTASGSITAQGEGSGSWRLGTASGSVTVRLPSESGFELHASTVSGTITTDRALTVQGTFGRRELRGKAGSGGFLLDVSTASGNIHIE